MDYPSQAPEVRPAFLQSPSSSSGVPDGYFAAQALRAGYFDIAGDIRREKLTGEPVSASEILQRELLKERIRGEIILRELTRVRQVEEEIRREVEIERALAMRRHHREFGPSFGIALDISERRVPLAHSAPEVAFENGFRMNEPQIDHGKNSAVSPFPPNLFGERVVEKRSPRKVTEIDHEKNSAVSALSLNVSKRMVEKRSPRKVTEIDHEKNSAVSALSLNAKPSTAALGGIKRKASELPDAARKKAGGAVERDWSCALCQVSATSREGLNEHLQGRRHKSNAELMGIIKNTGDPSSAKGADSPLTMAKDMVPKESKSNVKGKHPLIKGMGQARKEEQKTATLWCELCKVKCNSNSMLAAHLGGKKHTTRLEKSQSATTKAAAGKEKTAVEVQSIEARDEAKANSPSRDEGTNIVAARATSSISDEGTGLVEDSEVGKAGDC